MEIWKEIKGFKGKYAVSNFGNIKRLSYTIKQQNGISRHWDEMQLLFDRSRGNGYCSIKLWDKSTSKIYLVHRLVAIAFIRKVKNKTCVNHIDGNKSNNHISNLEWCTHKENTAHSLKNKLRVPKRYDENKTAKLSVEKVAKIKEMKLNGVKSIDIAKEFDVSDGLIAMVLKGKRWNTGDAPTTNITPPVTATTPPAHG